MSYHILCHIILYICIFSHGHSVWLCHHSHMNQLIQSKTISFLKPFIGQAPTSAKSCQNNKRQLLNQLLMSWLWRVEMFQIGSLLADGGVWFVLIHCLSLEVRAQWWPCTLLSEFAVNVPFIFSNQSSVLRPCLGRGGVIHLRTTGGLFCASIAEKG